MVDLAVLSAEHAEIEALVARLLLEIDAPEPSARLSGLRWRLNYVLMMHLAKEDKLLYPKSKALAETRILATHLSVESGGLAQAYLAYNCAWPIDRVEADWAGFGFATRKIMKTLRQRSLREERDLFPIINAEVGMV